MSPNQEPRLSTPVARRVLLAEDDDQLRSLIALALRDAGFDVVQARDGDELIDRLADALSPDQRQIAFDLILSDIRMPTFSALDVLAGAKRFIGKIPVVLLTAFGSPRTKEEAMRRGATLVLDKPIRLSELCETVANLLLHSQARAPAAL